MEFEKNNLTRKWVPRCHYYNHLGHIKPQYCTFLVNVRKTSVSDTTKEKDGSHNDSITNTEHTKT